MNELAPNREPENAAGQDRLLRSGECSEVQRRVAAVIQRNDSGTVGYADRKADEIIALVREQVEVEGHDPEKCPNPKCPACIRIVQYEHTGDNLVEWIEAYSDRPATYSAVEREAWRRVREYPPRRSSEASP